MVRSKAEATIKEGHDVMAAKEDAENVHSVGQTYDDVVSKHVFQGKPALRNWKVKTAQKESQLNRMASEERQLSDDTVLELSSSRPALALTPSRGLHFVQSMAVFATVAWISYATIHIIALPGGLPAIMKSPLALGGILASLLAPVALLWLCLAAWQRRSDAHMYAEALRQELQSLLFPTQDQAAAVNRDIQTLVQQAVEMSSSSRAAIKAIQRARQGLRAEIRDFAGVSQKTEFHIDRLAETLNKRADELITLTAIIGERTDLIEKGTQSGLAAWTEASESMQEKAAAIESTLAKGAAVILDASDVANDKLKTMEDRLSQTAETFSERIDDLSGRFAITNENFAGQAEKLQNVSQAIAAEASKLDNAMKVTLASQKAFEDGTSRVSGIAEHISSTLSSGVEKISENAETLFLRAESVERRLSEKAGSFETSAERFKATADSLEKVGEVAANKLGEALSMALSGSDTIVNSVRRSKEQLEKAAQEALEKASQFSSQADEKIAALTDVTAAKMEKISSLLTLFEERQAAIKATLEALDAGSGSASERIGNAADRIENSVRHLNDGAALAESKVSAIEAGTARARESVDAMSDILQDRLSVLGRINIEVSEQAGTLSEKIETQKDGLLKLQEQLKAQQEEITQAILAADMQIDGLGTKLFDQGQVTFDRAQELTEAMLGMEMRLVSDLVQLQDQSVSTEKAISAAAEKISHASQEAAPMFTDAVAKAEDLEGRYIRLQNASEETSADILSRLSSLGADLETSLDKFDSGAKNITGNFKTLICEVEDSLKSISAVAEGVGGKIEGVQSGIADRAADIERVGDGLRARIEAMQQNLSMYARDIELMVEKAKGQMQEASHAFGESSAVLDEKSQAAVAKLEDASRKYIEEGHRLSLLSEQSMHKAARIVATVQEESNRLTGSAQSSIQELKLAGDTLSVRAREVDEYIKASIRSTNTYAEELKAQVRVVADASSQSVDQIADAVSSLSDQADEARLVGQRLVQGMEVSRQKMSEEAERLNSVTGKAVQSAEIASNAFSKQTMVLYKAVQDVAVHAEKIRDNQWRTQREAFLSATKFVIEGLYSLSLDVSRHLENDLDQRVLRAYQRGDVAAFTRHLVETAPHIPSERAQRKFVEDGEFRSYVQRFIRQFEELLEQAQQNDYGDLLSGVFSSSDIGKLYKILCEIAGRNARIH